MKNLFACATLLALMATALPSQGQDQVPSDEDLDEMSLEELMNVPIRSASKKEETLYDAPLSSYTVTRTEIERSGVTSIMEALRLVPGLIVREQSNGVYDIHIRGLDNLLRYSQSFTRNNLLTLVMIDNRPAFNHNLGGTFWEALPIDLNDVERIEVVRGPAAPMFGPNAVTGVVNIITIRPQSDKPVVNATVQGGAPRTLIANAYAARKFGKVSAGVSVNHQDRDRFDTQFYNTATGAYENAENFIVDAAGPFPDVTQAMRRTGINGYFQYAPAEKITFDVTAGYQENRTLKNMLSSFGTTLNTSESNSFYTNVAAKVSNLSVRTSYVNGTDNILYGGWPNSYDYQVFDVNAEYAIHAGSRIQIVPGVNYQNAVFSDEEYTNGDEKGFLDGTQQNISTVSAFIRTDINVTDKLRVLGAVRADRFSTPDDMYLAWEFAGTYKVSQNNLLRLALTRSNSGAFMGYSKINYRGINDFRLPENVFIDQIQRGNESLELTTVNMIEVGFRSRLRNYLHLDIDVFHQQIENMSTLIAKGFSTFPPSPASDFIIEFDNVPVTARQTGITASLNFVPGGKWQIKPFVTIQRTDTENLPSSYIDPTLSTRQPGAGFPEVTYSNSRHNYTPSVFGGYYVNFKATEKFNINLNGYYLGSQTWYRNAMQSEERNGSVVVNARVSYAMKNGWSVFGNARNVVNRSKAEFQGADRLGALVMAGVSFQVK